MNKLLFLASYPKSGNTWFRAILNNLLSSHDHPVSINDLQQGSLNAASRSLFDDITGLDSSDLDFVEQQRLRPRVYESLAREAQQPVFLKIHDALLDTAAGEPLVPASTVAHVLYFVRNPLDVAVSFAHHEVQSVDEIIRIMADPLWRFADDHQRLRPQMPQCLSSWSGHVSSWLDAPDISLHVVRYEDMLAQPHASFAAALSFIGVERSADELAQAIRYSCFDALQMQEKISGFREKKPASLAFFRTGKAGGWQGVLSVKQSQQLIADHGFMMRRLGYEII